VEELELTIDQLVAGGDGLGRFEGIPIFVPRSAPGDRLRVRLTERKRDYGRAQIVKILAPGPGRRKPPCPHFARCGGCDLQHLEDGLQSRLKAAAFLETLHRLARIEPPGPVPVLTGAAWGYRLRTQLHTGVDAESGRVSVGYHARGTNDLVPVEQCPILAPVLEEQLATLPERLHDLGDTLPKRIDLAAGDGERFATAPVVADLPRGDLSLQVGAFTYRFDARCFFQGHRELLGTLVETAVGPWEGGLAVDLYAGVGLFSLPLARRYKKVLSVETDRIAIRHARANARQNRCSNLEIEAMAVESWVRRWPKGVDRALLDPPRSGLGGPARRVLLEQGPARVTYVSCHPAALARDLRVLRPAYRMESLTVLDLFPQTGHIEAVVQLVR
jgi:23S rRNA (uracil1939-C5)-methyltransferase